MKRLGADSAIIRLSLVAILIMAGAFAMDAEAAGGCGKCGARGDDSAAERAGCGGAGAGKGGCGKRRGAGKGRGAGRASDGGMGAGMEHHDNIHSLLDNHEAIQRYVEEIDGGVDTVTTSHDPEVTKTIRIHVREMQQRVESGAGLRWWDPTFAEVFRHHDKIAMYIEDIPGGVRVRETSEDPEVVKLIRQHALRGVSEFVARGRDRAHEPTPLPEGYLEKE